MELAWTTAPVIMVNDHLPFFKQIAEKEFTQNCWQRLILSLAKNLIFIIRRFPK